MVRIPLPGVPEQPAQSTQFTPTRVVPVQSFAGQQVSAAGQAMQRTGEAVSGIAAELQDKFDEAMIVKADLALNEAGNVTIGSYLDLVGEPATGDKKAEVFTSLEDKARAIESGLKNDVQRTEFRRVANARMQSWRQKADRHEHEQTNNFLFGGHVARADSFRAAAVDSVGTPEFLGNKEQMLSEVRASGKIQGLHPDAIKQLEFGATTKLHGDVIGSLVKNGHASAARDYLEGAKDEIAPEARTQLEGLVQKATVDKQSFDAARWSSNLGGTLPEQIERLNQLVEDKSTSLPIEVRDAAEARLRSMEQVDYQSRARVGNETQDSAMAYATLNRVRTFDELPPQMRKALEDSGRAESFKVYLEQGRQFGTTQRGQEILRRALDTAWLASQDLDVLKADANANLSPEDNGNLLAMWYKSRQQKPPPGVSDSLINMTVDRRMRELKYLPIDKTPTQEQANRRNWVIESVQRALGTGPVDAKTMDEAIEQALGNTMVRETNTGLTGWFPTEVVLPESAMTPAERSAGSYRTAYGNVPAKQVSEESIKAKLEDIRAVNRARSESNASNPYGPQVPLIPESNEAAVQLLRAEQEDRRVRRERAAKTAGDWLRRNRAEYGKDAWHYLPADLKDELDRTGMGVSVRSDYEYYDRTHDFLGRPIEAWQSDPNSMMHQFSSPWGR